MKNLEETIDFNSQGRLSDEEKKEMTRSVLEIIGIDSLKKEISEELRKEKHKVGEFFKHPTILLLLGFILTTVLGTYLSVRYQNSEWKKQQIFLSKQRYTDEKQTIADEATKAVAETLSAGDDFLYLFTWETNDAEEANRQNNWKQTSSKWRNNFDAISQKLAVYFNGEVGKLFREIKADRDNFSREIDNLIEAYNKDEKKIKAQVKTDKSNEEILKKINRIREEKVNRLTKLMVEEILADRNPQERSFISFL